MTPHHTIGYSGEEGSEKGRKKEGKKTKKEGVTKPTKFRVQCYETPTWEASDKCIEGITQIPSYLWEIEFILTRQ